MWNLRLYSLTWNFGKQTSLFTLQQYTVQGVQLNVSAPAEITITPITQHDKKVLLGKTVLR